MAGELFFLLAMFWLFFIILGIIIVSFIFWIWSIIDITKRKFKDDNDKIVWILVVIFTGIIGSIIYYFVVYRPNKTANKKKK